MSKKLLIGVVPLLVTMAFALVTTAAVAAPAKWSKNKGPALENNKPEQTIAWGTLSLESTAGNVSCQNAAAGTVEDVAAEPQNSSPTTLFATYNCKIEKGECPLVAGHEIVLGEGLPWPGKNEEEEAGDELYRSIGGTEASPIRVNIVCIAGPSPQSEKPVGNLIFKSGKVGNAPTEKEVFGESKPAFVNGSNAGRPSEVSFDAKSQLSHLASRTEVEVGEKGEKPFQTEMNTTEKSAEVSGKELVKKGAHAGSVVNGIPVPTDGNKPEPPFPPLCVFIAVEEAKGTWGLAEFSGSKYEFKGKLCEARFTGKFTIQINPGSNKFEEEDILGTTKGKLKVEGYEGTPVPLFTMVP